MMPQDSRWSWRGLLGFVVSVILVTVLVSMASFMLLRLTPGNSATAIAKKRAHAGAHEEQIKVLIDDLGLNDPLIVQYGRWLGDALQGDFGVSERSGLLVKDEIARRVWPTAQIVVPGILLAVLVGGFTGVASSISPRRGIRTLTRGLALVGVSIPAFWLGYLFILFFSERLGWLPTSGSQGVKSLIMPVSVLAIPAMGVISRVSAVSVDDALRQAFITTAKARGASTFSILVKDVGLYVFGPILSVVGLQFSVMMAGTVVVETVFGRPGLGSFFLEAVSLRDTSSVQAVVLVYALGFVLINRGTDALVAALDPRIHAREVGR